MQRVGKSTSAIDLNAKYAVVTYRMVRKVSR